MSHNVSYHAKGLSGYAKREGPVMTTSESISAVRIHIYVLNGKLCKSRSGGFCTVCSGSVYPGSLGPGLNFIYITSITQTALWVDWAVKPQHKQTDTALRT